ncbi:MAG: hypothetical protein IJR50_04575 [Treponema sp.]|nr:hypothetical protein [Treponema sp.]
MRRTNCHLFYHLLIFINFIFSGCTSTYGDTLDAPYLILTWLGALAGYTISDFIWATDDAGNKYTPWWEVGAWFFFTLLGAALGYVKRFFLFSGFFIAVAVPVASMTIVTLLVRAMRKRRSKVRRKTERLNEKTEQ